MSFSFFYPRKSVQWSDKNIIGLHLAEDGLRVEAEAVLVGPVLGGMSCDYSGRSIIAAVGQPFFGVAFTAFFAAFLAGASWLQVSWQPSSRLPFDGLCRSLLRGCLLAAFLATAFFAAFLAGAFFAAFFAGIFFADPFFKTSATVVTAASNAVLMDPATSDAIAIPYPPIVSPAFSTIVFSAILRSLSFGVHTQLRIVHGNPSLFPAAPASAQRDFLKFV